jgi:putative endonuclease
MHYAYILRSLKDGTYYYGSADDIAARLKQHNTGKVRYTKGHLPHELSYREEFATRSEAVVRQRFFKTIADYRWLRAKGIIR